MNDELRKAFEAAAKKRIINSVPDMPEHKFSLRFERRMEKLIRRADRRAEICTNIPLRRFFTVLAAAVITASFVALSAFGVKSIIKELLMNNFSTHTNVKLTDSDSSPGLIEDIYSFDVPEGFELAYETKDVINQKAVYECEYWNGIDNICINQFAKTAYNNNVNTEDRTMECIEINGHEGYVVEMSESDCTVTWDNGDYIMEISASIDKNAVIDIANSMQKSE